MLALVGIALYKRHKYASLRGDSSGDGDEARAAVDAAFAAAESRASSSARCAVDSGGVRGGMSHLRALAQADEDDDAGRSLVGAAAEEESEEYEEAAELCSVERGRSPLVSAFRTPHFAVEMVRVGTTSSPDARTLDAS